MRLAAALLAAALLGVVAFAAAPLPAGLLARRPVAAVRFTDRAAGLLREVASRADGRAIPFGVPAGNLK